MNSITTNASKQLADSLHPTPPFRIDEYCIVSLSCCLDTLMIIYYHVRYCSNLKDKSKGIEGLLTYYILSAAPLYSLFSTFIIITYDSYDGHWNFFLYVLRDLFGAGVVDSLISLCYVYIGGETIERNTLETLHFYELIAQQYAFVRPCLFFVAAYLRSSKDYKDGDWSFDSGYIYITSLTIFSVTVAAIGLFLFLNTAKGIMKTSNLDLKFKIVTFMVFGTYWQGVIMQLLVLTMTSDSTLAYRVAAGCQNWLVCVEMLPTAIAMQAAFRPQGIVNNEEPTVEYGVKQTAPESEHVIAFKSSTDRLYKEYTEHIENVQTF